MNPMQEEPVKKIVNQEGVVIDKIYNPSVGKYDVVVTTGPGFATKRQEALEAMAQLLQGNPQLWQVAGDLFVKNMDWPGAQDLAKRFQKTLDPKVLADEDNPALVAANHQMEAMQAEMRKAFATPELQAIWTGLGADTPNLYGDAFGKFALGKFRGLADGILTKKQVDEVIRLCWTVETLPDAGAIARMSPSRARSRCSSTKLAVRPPRRSPTWRATAASTTAASIVSAKVVTDSSWASTLASTASSTT